MKKTIFGLFCIFAFAFNVSTQTPPDGKLVHGKYGCTASKYNGRSYEYTPRGSFVIKQDGDTFITVSRSLRNFYG